MLADSFNREDLQGSIFQLEQALYNHQQWYNSVIRSLICRLPADKHDISADAHKECRFGQWYYDAASESLRQNPGFIALGDEHQKMHQVTTKLLIAACDGKTISPNEYDEFANAIEKMRLETSVLQRELSESLYNRDALTGAINRLSMLPVLRDQQALVKRKVQSACIAMLDVDHFKAVNDQYGHTAGDYVLAGVSRFIMENIRPYDKLFRVGGEEFVICFQNADMTLACEMVERLRLGIAGLQINVDANKTLSITASFGVAPIVPNCTIEQSLEYVDKALYEAKDRGRNNMQIWEAS